MIVCEQVRKVQGGYVVVVRFPFGTYRDNGEVVCHTFEDVVALLRRSADEPEPKEPMPSPATLDLVGEAKARWHERGGKVPADAVEVPMPPTADEVICADCGRDEGDHHTFRPVHAPPGCVCNPLEWSTPDAIGSICDTYEALVSGTNCNRCEHDRECHQDEGDLMKIEAHAGEHLSTVAGRAVHTVTRGEPEVSFTFNDIILTAKPGMSEADICAEYDRERNARRDAYEATPAYKEEYDREKRAAFDAALGKAPPMTLKDADGWAKARAANTDPYSNAVMVYAETWARLMEGAMAEGATVAGCARELSYLAAVDGLTGFMYGAAVSTLAQVWEHGEELRRWVASRAKP